MQLDSVGPGAYQDTTNLTYDAGGAIEQHHAVSLDENGEAVQAGDGDDLLGIADGDADAGDTVTVTVSGVRPAAVEAGVAALDRLVSTADGTLDTDVDGAADYKALTDAGDSGGLRHGGSFDDTVAMVQVR